MAAEVATYLPGRRVEGVRVRPDGILVQIACRYGENLGALSARVRKAVLTAEPTCPRVDVDVCDLVTPGPGAAASPVPGAVVSDPGVPGSGVPVSDAPVSGAPGVSGAPDRPRAERGL